MGDSSNSKRPAEDQKKSNPMVLLARYSEIGFVLPAAVIVGYLMGLGLDHWLHQHWIYIAGIIFGAILGFVKMIQMALASSNERNE
jgi:F0F1-type ATP synthase assembly protein I